MKKKPRKTKPKKAKKQARKQRAAKRKPSRREPQQRPRPLAATLGVGLTAATASEAAEASDDALGACYWVDGTGQNHCKITTQSECDAISGTFRLNKRCAGGVG